jgi:hypothetical protein
VEAACRCDGLDLGPVSGRERERIRAGRGIGLMTHSERKVGVTNEEHFAATALRAWQLAVDRLDQLFSALRDEELQTEVAPGRNRIFYLLGHLTAVHDRLFPLLGLGDRLHPELDEEFLTNPDRKSPDRVSAQDLRRAWSEVNRQLAAAFAAVPPAAWLQRHEAVSEEDFAKEPLRNRLSVLLSRTTHAGFHAGQIALTQKRK